MSKYNLSKGLDFTLDTGKNAMIHKINDIYEVTISALATKQLQKIPLHIKEKLYEWIEQVKFVVIKEANKHDY